jgi:hypothetical protein
MQNDKSVSAGSKVLLFASSFRRQKLEKKFGIMVEGRRPECLL